MSSNNTLSIKSSIPKLTVRDIFILNYFNGKSIDHIPNTYNIETFGSDYKASLKYLCDNGLLQLSPSLEFLKMPQLKDILRTHGLKVSGKKEQLIARIKESLVEDTYINTLPKVFQLTLLGKNTIDENYIYIYNQKHYFGFTISELKQVYEQQDIQNIQTSLSVIYSLLKKRQSVAIKEKNYGSLRGALYNSSVFLKESQKFTESLKCLLAVKYLEYSGITDDCYVTSYDDLSRFGTYETQEIDKLIIAQNIDKDALASLFFTAINELVPPLPFQYFSKDISLKILIAELNGKQNIFSDFRQYANIPEEENPNYRYYNFNNIYSNNNDISDTTKKSTLTLQHKNQNTTASLIADIGNLQLSTFIFLLIFWPIGFYKLFNRRENYNNWKLISFISFIIWSNILLIF